MGRIEPLKQGVIPPLPLNEEILWCSSVPDESTPLQRGLGGVVRQERLTLQSMEIKFGERKVDHLENRCGSNPTPRELSIHRVRDTCRLKSPTNDAIQVHPADNLTVVLNQPRITIARCPCRPPAQNHFALCVQREIGIRPQRLTGREVLPVSRDKFQKLSSMINLGDHQGDHSPSTSCATICHLATLPFHTSHAASVKPPPRGPDPSIPQYQLVISVDRVWRLPHNHLLSYGRTRFPIMVKSINELGAQNLSILGTQFVNVESQ